MKNLGIDLVNRVEIVMMVMEDLFLNILCIELVGVKNLGELVDIFVEKLEVRN